MTNEQGYEEIKSILRPGDIINQVGHPKWYEFWLSITYGFIKWHQRRLFGKHSNYRDTHTMIYFDPIQTFSVEMPKAILKPLSDYYKSDFTIYRIKNPAITSEMTWYMKEHAKKMVDRDYDVGQLLDIAVNGILGYANRRKAKIFDMGDKNKVCSVGVRVLLERLNQKHKFQTNGKWLFHSLNPNRWSTKKIANYRGVDVEMTTPAHFANTDQFENELKLVARFNNGVRVC